MTSTNSNSPYINPKERDNTTTQYRHQLNTDSFTELEKQSRGLIDKLLFYTVEHIHFSDVEVAAAEIGATTERLRLPNVGHTFRVLGQEGERLSFILWGRDKPSSRKLSLIPADFRDYDHLRSFVESIIGRNQFECADNYRTDFAVDVPDAFDNVKKYIFAARKRLCRSYYNDGAYLNGLQIGRSPEVVSVYDKAKQLGIDEDLTRVEVQLTGRSNPIKNLTELPSLIDHNKDGYYRPFKKVDFEGFDFTEISQIKKRSDVIKFVFAQTLTNELGVHLARRKCNESGKFERDFSRFVSGRHYPLDLNKVWLRDMCAYFGQQDRLSTILEFWEDN